MTSTDRNMESILPFAEMVLCVFIIIISSSSIIIFPCWFLRESISLLDLFFPGVEKANGSYIDERGPPTSQAWGFHETVLPF